MSEHDSGVYIGTRGIQEGKSNDTTAATITNTVTMTTTTDTVVFIVTAKSSPCPQGSMTWKI